GRADCNLEWMAASAPAFLSRGLPSNKVFCSDGNPACDFDLSGSNNSCTFHVRICINNADPRVSECTPPSAISLFEVKSPRTTSMEPADVMNLNTLESQGGAAGFGMTVMRGDQTVYGGAANGNPDRCSQVFNIVVPRPSGSLKSGRKKLRIRTTTASGKHVVDSLKLECRP